MFLIAYYLSIIINILYLATLTNIVWIKFLSKGYYNRQIYRYNINNHIHELCVIALKSVNNSELPIKYE